MPDDLEDDLGAPPIRSGSHDDGLRERTWRQSQRIKELRTELEAERTAHVALQAVHTTLQATHTTATAEHATALESAASTHAGVLRTMERTSALTAAGVDPDGSDVVLSAYNALGDDAPPLGDWLKSEALPKHVACYLGGDTAAKPAHNPDAGAAGRATSNGIGDHGFTQSMNLDDLRAAKEQGLLG